GGFHQAAGQNGGFPDVEHATGITEPAILDDRDVDVHDVAVLENLVARNAVADHVVHGSADGRREGRVAGRRVTHGGRLHVQHVGDVFHAETIQLARGDARPYELGKIIQCGCGRLTGCAHFFEVGGVGDEGGHGIRAGLVKK